MTEHLDSAATAQDLLDALLPRKDPRYEAAHAFLTAYLSTDASTRRLALRALKGATAQRAAEEPSRVGSGASDSGSLATGHGTHILPNPAGPAVDALPPEATGRADPEIGPGTAIAAGGNPVSAPARPDCGGKLCVTGNGKTVHHNDPSCSKFGKRARA